MIHFFKTEFKFVFFIIVLLGSMNQALGQLSVIIESNADSIQCRLYEINGKREPIRELLPERIQGDSVSIFYKYRYFISEKAHSIRMDIKEIRVLEIKSIHFVWPNRTIRLNTPEQMDNFLELKPHMVLNSQNDKFQIEFSRHKYNYIFFKGQVNRYGYFSKKEENYFSNKFMINISGSRSIGFMVSFVSGGKFRDGELAYQYELTGKENTSFSFTEKNYSRSISMISVEFPFIYSRDTVTLIKENLFSYNGFEVVDYSFVGCNIEETDSSIILRNAGLPGLRPRIDIKLGVIGFEWYPLLFYVIIFFLLVVFNKMLFIRKKGFLKMVK